MKIQAHHYVIIGLLILCSILLGLNYTSGNKVSKESKGENEVKEIGNNAIEIIMDRTSIRSYTDEPVSEEHIDKILKAGMAAPTAANKQPWAFIVVTDREKLDALAGQLPYAKMLSQAPAAIVVCGVPELGLEGIENQYWVQDCSAASQNILLAIHDLGLGGVWTGAYPMKEREKAVREILEIPKNIIPLNVIAFGHPDKDYKPRDKYRPERIHYNKW
ncbi:MAG: nitroreductase family protein [Vulcanimicrobiota bacterium]